MIADYHTRQIQQNLICMLIYHFRLLATLPTTQIQQQKTTVISRILNSSIPLETYHLLALELGSQKVREIPV